MLAATREEDPFIVLWPQFLVYVTNIFCDSIPIQSRHLQAQLRFLKCQIEILQQRLPGNRIIIDPTERQRLLTLGKELEHQIQDTLLVISLKTYKNWLLEERRGKKPNTLGRKRIPSDLYNLVARFAR